ncbi:DUF3122 domain-containing protein [Synechococcus sp. CS-1327]|nr:DUF3122 domain-containing protein [Synechococcus sp. CS-1326]MCT0231973.1 DUF3122 domain-containing protein [Synechococcus sp. CS-1327]
MIASSPGAHARSFAEAWRLHRPLLKPLFAAVLLVLALLLPLQAQAGADPQRWTLTDSSGHLWGLNLFEQPDPAYPAGWRLRLTARSPGQEVDHQKPLQLSDGLGSSWLLPNRSEELVQQGEAVIPLSSAQFDIGALDPRPSDVLPLQLELPIANQAASALVALQPELVQALHALPTNLAP